MIKKKISLIIFLFLTSCGYEAMYSKKNLADYDFTINEISYSGDRQLNIRINQKLMAFRREGIKKTINLEIKSEFERIITAKDSKGDSTSYEIQIKVSLKVLKAKSPTNINYIESFKYNNLDNKIELRNYEKEIKFNLSENITNKIIYDLSKLSKEIITAEDLK